MESVGMRELKDRLAHYLRSVRRGEVITVTLRGKPVARLVPVRPAGATALPQNVEKRMWELTAEGLLQWNGGAAQLPEPAASNRGPQLLSDLVVEDRE
jgi:prevent-host-death family protein